MDMESVIIQMAMPIIRLPLPRIWITISENRSHLVRTSKKMGKFLCFFSPKQVYQGQKQVHASIIFLPVILSSFASEKVPISREVSSTSGSLRFKVFHCRLAGSI